MIKVPNYNVVLPTTPDLTLYTQQRIVNEGNRKHLEYEISVTDTITVKLPWMPTSPDWVEIYHDSVRIINPRIKQKNDKDLYYLGNKNSTRFGSAIGILSAKSVNNETLDGDLPFIKKNDEIINYQYLKGHTVAIFNGYTLDLESIDTYNTYDYNDSTELFLALLQIKNGKIVVLVSFIGCSLDARTRDYLNLNFGTTKTDTWYQMNYAHTIIAQKNVKESIAHEIIYTKKYNVPSTPNLTQYKKQSALGLLLYYDAAESSSYYGGNIIFDISGNSNHGEIVTGYNPNYIPLQDNNNIIKFASDLNTKINFSIEQLTSSVITIEMWANVKEFSGGMLFGWKSYSVYTATGALGFNTGNGDIYGISSARVTQLDIKNKWVQYVFIMSAADYTLNKIFINGVEEKLSQQIPAQNKSAATFNYGKGRIGGWLADDGYQIHMNLSIFKIYNQPLEQLEITEIYNETIVRYNKPFNDRQLNEIFNIQNNVITFETPITGTLKIICDTQPTHYWNSLIINGKNVQGFYNYTNVKNFNVLDWKITAGTVNGLTFNVFYEPGPTFQSNSYVIIKDCTPTSFNGNFKVLNSTPEMVAFRGNVLVGDVPSKAYITKPGKISGFGNLTTKQLQGISLYSEPIIITQPHHGYARLTTDRKSIAYVPNTNYSGFDTFSWTLINQHGQIGIPKCVQINVMPAFSPPPPPPPPTPGVNWTYQTGLSTTLFNPSAVTVLVWANMQFYAGGSDGRIATSPDGVIWTYHPGLSNTNWGSFFVRDIVWTGTQFCAVGDNGNAATSIDGVNWTFQSNLQQRGLVGIRGIVWSGTQFCVVGDTGSVATSPDGVNWTVQRGLIQSAGAFNIRGIVWTGTQYCAYGTNGRVVTSADAISWTYQPALNNQGWSEVLSIAWSGLQFCAVGTNGDIATSPDGVTWTFQSGLFLAGWNATASISKIIWTGSQYCVGGVNGDIATSPDGVTWTFQNGLSASGWGQSAVLSIAWSGERFCVGGSNSRIAISNS